MSDASESIGARPMSDADRIREALTYISADCDRDTWFRVLAAIKSALGEDGRDIAEEWSATAPDSYRPQDFASAWRSIREGGGVTIATLFGIAKEGGYVPHGNGRPVAPDPEAIAKREARQQAEVRRREARAKAAAELAAKLWKAAERGGTPYTERKGVKPTGTMKRVRATDLPAILGYTPSLTDGADLHGLCVVVPVKVGDALASLELIDERGRKWALAGSRRAGGYWSVNPLPTEGGEGLTVIVAEGVATALSAHEATDHPAVAAFSCGNLEPVARVMRERFPAARIVIAADIGKGETKAHDAARAVGGFVATPDFGAERPEGMKDLNDLMQLQGAEAVNRSVANAKAPDALTHQPIAANATGAAVEAWPATLEDEALYGLPGEIVRTIEPHTEADQSAILIQTLVAFGALVGRGPHIKVEADQHHARLNAVLVGDSSKARKGTSWNRVKELFEPINELDGLRFPRVVEGLSTGEGLKWAVRDAIVKIEREKTGPAVAVETDPGVTDKRVLVTESEFAQVLRQCSRHGNTLSATVRCAWDNGNLQSLTKNDPVVASGAHICIIGHITAQELRAELTATDSANGFANRFLFMAVKRSKMLAFGGGDLAAETRATLTRRLAEAAALARQRGQMELSPEARELWVGVYPVLSQGHPGLLGAVTARSEAQTLRLALVYALMDGAETIEPAHLRAALAVWERCEDSARHIFGSALGDRIADSILQALRANKRMTRAQISDLFSRNETAERISAALALLQGRGLAKPGKVEGAGRHAETWEAA
jgi:phage/plasmid primase-like uncharacterized protein